jgi:hypothetical protein
MPRDFWAIRLARFCGHLRPPDWLAYDPPAWDWRAAGRRAAERTAQYPERKPALP